MNSFDFSDYKLDESDGVFTYKNVNTTLGFVRFNGIGEVEYIFVNPILEKRDSNKVIKISKGKNR